jgi:sugar phosphate permease
MTSAAHSHALAGNGFRWVVAGLIFLVYTVAAADRANIGIALPYIRKDFELSNTEAGAVISVFFLFYSLFLLPAGFLVSRVNIRKTFPLFLILTSLCTAFIGAASSAGMLKLWRALLGIAEAPLPLMLLATINRWFPPKEKGFVTGIFLAAAKFGPVIVPPLGAIIITYDSWRSLFYIFAVPGFVLAIVWAFLVRNDPLEGRRDVTLAASPNDALVPAEVSLPHTSEKSFGAFDKLIRYRKIEPVHTTRAVFTCWDIWGCGLGYLLLTGVVNVLLAWLPTYLTTVKQFNLMSVGIVASAPFMGGVLGNLAGGFLSDRVLGKRRKPTMIISSVSTTIMMLLLINAPNDVVAVGLLMFLTGFLLNIGYSSFSVYSMGRASKEVYPIAASLVNAAGQAGGALAPFITGVLLDAYSWTAVFIFLAISALASLVAVLLISEPAS